MTPMLATDYLHSDPKGTLVSEKFDGIRAIWDGKKLRTREGNEITAHESFIQNLPKNIILDGELWMGYKTLQKLAAIIRKKTPLQSDWANITFMVFDAPEMDAPFEERLCFIDYHVDYNESINTVIHSICKGYEDLANLMSDIIDRGGEGLILRNPKSKYEGGRSSDFLKYKLIETAEAVVIGYGKKIDVVKVDFKGVIFNLYTRCKVAIGARITFEYSDLTNSGKPRNTAFICVRDYE